MFSMPLGMEIFLYHFANSKINEQLSEICSITFFFYYGSSSDSISSLNVNCSFWNNFVPSFLLIVPTY